MRPASWNQAARSRNDPVYAMEHQAGEAAK